MIEWEQIYPVMIIGGIYLGLWIICAAVIGMEFIDSLATPITGCLIIISWVGYWYFQASADSLPSGGTAQ